MSVDVASLSTALSTTGVSNQLTIFGLKQSMDAQSSEVAQLLQGLPAPQPSYMGAHVDTHA